MPWDRRAQDFRQAAACCRFVTVLVEELAIGCDQWTGPAHDEGDLVVAVALVDQECNTCECGNVVFNGAERMIETACDLVGLQPLEIKADGLDAVGLPGADILLLAAAGDLDTALPEGIDIADDGPDAAIEQSEGEVLVTEQAVLVAGLGSHAQDARAAQAVDAMLRYGP